MKTAFVHVVFRHKTKKTLFLSSQKQIKMEEIITFLTNVLHNNNREWFHEHKQEYQSAQAKFNAIAEQIIDGVSKFDPDMQGLTLKDCTYRFYRDTRFSADKTPYKTHFGVFVCKGGKKSMLSGYYFQVQPKESEDYFNGNMLCTGMYMPFPETLKNIREEILYNGQPLETAIKNAKGFNLDTYRNMKRVPNGYPKDHPYAEYFKQRDWLLMKEVDDKHLYSPNLVEWVLEEFKKTKDFCQWLNKAGS